MSCGIGKDVNIVPQTSIKLPTNIQSGGSNLFKYSFKKYNNKYRGYFVKKHNNKYYSVIADYTQNGGTPNIVQKFILQKGGRADGRITIGKSIVSTSPYRISYMHGHNNIQSGGNNIFREIMESISHIYAPFPSIIRSTSEGYKSFTRKFIK